MISSRKLRPKGRKPLSPDAYPKEKSFKREQTHHSRGSVLTKASSDSSESERPMFSDRGKTHEFPIPRGDSAYSLAKRYEYIDKNLLQAEIHYREAIRQGERVESAVKDLAGVLHQQGRTPEACEVLKKHEHLFQENVSKFHNLLQNLESQTNGSLRKYLKIQRLPANITEEAVKAMFSNSNRIHEIILTDKGEKKEAMLQFLSLSAARKTMDCFKYHRTYPIEHTELEVNESAKVLFDSKLFHDVSSDDSEVMMECNTSEDNQNGELSIPQMIGFDLYRTIFDKEDQ